MVDRDLGAWYREVCLNVDLYERTSSTASFRATDQATWHNERCIARNCTGLSASVRYRAELVGLSRRGSHETTHVKFDSTNSLQWPEAAR